MKNLSYILLWIILISWTITICEARELFVDYNKSMTIFSDYINKKEKTSQEETKDTPIEVEALVEGEPVAVEESLSDSSSEQEIKDRIREIAYSVGFYEMEDYFKVAQCESRIFTPGNYEKAINEFNPYNKSNDRGYMQISRRWHPEVSDECAYDLECATLESIRIQKERGWQEWSCGYYTGVINK